MGHVYLCGSAISRLPLKDGRPWCLFNSNRRIVLASDPIVTLKVGDVEGKHIDSFLSPESWVDALRTHNRIFSCMDETRLTPLVLKNGLWCFIKSVCVRGIGGEKYLLGEVLHSQVRTRSMIG